MMRQVADGIALLGRVAQVPKHAMRLRVSAALPGQVRILEVQQIREWSPKLLLQQQARQGRSSQRQDGNHRHTRLQQHMQLSVQGEIRCCLILEEFAGSMIILALAAAVGCLCWPVLLEAYPCNVVLAVHMLPAHRTHATPQVFLNTSLCIVDLLLLQHFASAVHDFAGEARIIQIDSNMVQQGAR